MRRFTVPILGVLIVLLMAAPAYAVSARPQLAIPHVAKGPAIDGTLSDEAWKSAKHVQLAYDLRHKGTPRRRPTCTSSSDDKALYVAFDARADRRDRRQPAHRRRRLRHRRRSAGRPVARRAARLPLPLHRDAAGHALPAFQRELDVRAEMAERRQSCAPAGSRSRCASRSTSCAATGARAGRSSSCGSSQKTDDLLVWAFENGQSDHNDVVYAGTLERALVRRDERAAETAHRAVRRRGGGGEPRRRQHDALGRRRVDPAHADGVVRRHIPSRLLQRRTRPAVDLADRLPAFRQRGAAVLRADAAHQPVRLRGVPERQRALHARDPDAQTRLRARRLARPGHVQRVQRDRRPPHRQRLHRAVAQHEAHDRLRLPGGADVRAGLRRPPHHDRLLHQRPQAQGRST